MSSPMTAVKQEELSHRSNAADHDLSRWQRRLLPFMTRFIVAMAAAFFCFSALHLYQITAFIEAEHGQNIRTIIEGEIAKAPADKLTSEAVMQHSLILLDADALDKRYHQAGALLMSRIWSRQLAFITGMVLAFMGAVFILGKMSESVSEISGGASEWKVAISSASPGIILSLLGTVLLVSSLFVRASLDVADGPAYVNVLRRTNVTAPADPTRRSDDPAAPLNLDELGLDQQNSAAPKKDK